MQRFTSTILATVCLLAFLAFMPNQKPKPKKLVKAWETDTTLRTPESVLYDRKNDVLYVANIDGKSDELDGAGFISKVSLDGKIENLRWTSGLNAPKGMGIHNNRLYVTDVYRLVAINLETGQAEKTWDAIPQKGAFLNDVTVDKDGTVYVSDNRNSKIYRLKGDSWEVWMEGAELNNPNGLLALDKNRMLVGSTKIGALRMLDMNTKTMTTLADGMANTDGIVTDGKDYFVSDWSGQIFHVPASGDKQQLLDVRADKINTADMEYVPKRKLLVVPTFFKNKLIAYKVE